MYSNYIPKHKKVQNGIAMYSERGQNAGSVVGDEWRKNIITAWMLTKPPAPDVTELKYKSRAVKGAIFNGKRLSLFEVK